MAVTYGQYPALNKHTLFGFALQSTEGTAITTGLTWIPTTDRTDFAFQGNIQDFRQADYTNYQHLVYSSGAWWEGGWPISLQPVDGSLTNLVTWITSRPHYNQGRFATVVLDDSLQARYAYDVKVATATFSFRKGEPINCTLQLIGKRTGSSCTLSTPNTGGPYLWSDTAVTTGDYGDTLSSDVNFESLEITIDNHVEAAEEGFRLTAANYPTRLYNIAGIDCFGSFDRDYVDTTWYDGYIAQIAAPFATTSNAAITAVLTRGGQALTFTMPRVIQKMVRREPDGSNEGRIVEGIDFKALGSDDGNTAPITLSH